MTDKKWKDYSHLHASKTERILTTIFAVCFYTAWLVALIYSFWWILS